MAPRRELRSSLVAEPVRLQLECDWSEGEASSSFIGKMGDHTIGQRRQELFGSIIDVILPERNASISSV
jgi:hypothetical protein